MTEQFGDVVAVEVVENPLADVEAKVKAERAAAKAQKVAEAKAKKDEEESIRLETERRHYLEQRDCCPTRRF